MAVEDGSKVFLGLSLLVTSQFRRGRLNLQLNPEQLRIRILSFVVE